MNPFRTFNQKSINEPLPFTPEGFRGGGYVFNYKKNGTSKREFMSRSTWVRYSNAIWSVVSNVVIPVAAVIFGWKVFWPSATIGGQVLLVALALAALAWLWITLPYTIFFIRIIKQRQQ